MKLKIYFFILLLGFEYPLLAQRDLVIVRDIFHQVGSQAQLDSILNYSWNKTNEKDADVFAYQLVSKGMMAEYVFSPLTKLSYFQEGTKQLDQLIEVKPSVENVYLRLLMQLEAPWFLGYHDELESDLAYIVDHLPNSALSNDVKSQFMDKLLLSNRAKLDMSKIEKMKEEMSKMKTLTKR